MSDVTLGRAKEILDSLGIQQARIGRAANRVRKVMQIIPKGENRPLYELAKESAEEFLNGQRYHGMQDVILLDSVLSIGRRYKLVVQWVDYYKQYVAARGLEHSLETLVSLELEDYRRYLSSVGVIDIPDQSRLGRAIELANLFVRKYPKSEDEQYGLFRWLRESEGWTQFLRPYSERDEVCRAFTDFMLRAFNRELPGERTLLGLAPFQYLRMQCGEDTLKPDRRVMGILKNLSGVSKLSPIGCIALASCICEELGIKLVELDQVMVCEDYLENGQNFQTLLEEAEG